MLHITQISQHDFDRLVELRRRFYRQKPDLEDWAGAQLEHDYRERLARGEISVWIASQEGQDCGYAWFRVYRGEFSLKEIVACQPDNRESELYRALIAAGLAWVVRQRGKTCTYTGQAGNPALADGLKASGFVVEEEHIQMGTSLEKAILADGGLATRAFTEIGDASWLLTLIERCMECRPAYDRQDILAVIRRNDDLSLVAWESDQPAGFLLGETHFEQGEGGEKRSLFYVAEIGILPELRRQGYATRLLAAGFDRARRRGMQEARLHVLQSNTAGQRLYYQLGFEEVERVGWWRWALTPA